MRPVRPIGELRRQVLLVLHRAQIAPGVVGVLDLSPGWVGDCRDSPLTVSCKEDLLPGRTEDAVGPECEAVVVQVGDRLQARELVVAVAEAVPGDERVVLLCEFVVVANCRFG